MNGLRMIRATRILSICLLMVIGGITALAQGPNLLTNPGFEDPFVDQGGDPPRQVAQGWTAWHISPEPGAPTFQNQQPEYLPAAPDTARIRSGNNAQFLTSFFATHTGGVYQQVSGITPGTQLTFSTYAYIWSSAFDNVDVSEMDGGVVVQVGIDPTGGTDPQSGNIVWSGASQQYDAWNLYTVTASAARDTVTVYIRSTISAPAKNNNIYLDDASLTVAGGAAQPTATATSTSTVAPPTATSTPTETVVEAPPTFTATPTATHVEDGGIILPSPTGEGVASTEVPTSEPLPTDTEEPTTVPPTAEVVTEPPPATATSAVPTLDPTVWRNIITITIREGDSIAGLAALYGSTIDAILIANEMDTDTLLLPGNTIRIPVRLPPVVPQITETVEGPTAVPPTQAPPPTATPVTTTTIYVVQPGDTLSRIAARFNTTVQAIAQLNGIVNPDRILIGLQLTIPGSGGAPTAPPPPQATVPPTATPATGAPATYMVMPGDTLYEISLRFNVSLARLIQVNAITDPNLIYVGQVLILPA